MGLSILVIDKDVKALIRIADVHYMLEKGRVVWSGDSGELTGNREVQQRRHEHPAERRDRRQHRRATVAEFPPRELPSDLEADDEEEDQLDGAFDVKPNSRLSCQIKVTEALDGLVLRVEAEPGAPLDVDEEDA